MKLTRRDFLRNCVVVPAGMALLPGSVLRAMFAPPGGNGRNLVLVDLRGGNDGLNMVVPYGLNGGTYYSEFRPTLGVPLAKVLPLTGSIGLNQSMASLKTHYDAGRLAIAQGVSYPEPSYSHEVAQRIWQNGDPANAAPDGWLARFLAQLGAPSSPNAVALSDTLTLMLSGAGSFVPNFQKLADFTFPYDGDHPQDKANREAAFTAIASGLANPGGQPGGGQSAAAAAHLAAMSATSTGILDLIQLFSTVPPFQHVGVYPPNNGLSGSLKTTVRLMHANIGMRYFHLLYGGFDTHADQEQGDFHSLRLGMLSDALHAFWQDLQAVGLADDTLVVVFSEFGRTVYENGSGGTDHGSVNPVLVFGNAVTGGLANAHPSMDPGDLTGEGELPMAADFRDVFGTVVSRWLGGDAGAVFPGHTLAPLPFLP
jgi:uncharacterized protein (DUF1501 family)